MPHVFGVLDTLLLLAWILHYGRGLPAGALQYSLLILGSCSLAGGFLWSQFT